jgi:DnaJ-class molecular chaperone
MIYTCPKCNGNKKIINSNRQNWHKFGEWICCPTCGGRGIIVEPQENIKSPWKRP